MEKAGIYARAGIATYWVIDQLREDISLTEMALEPERRRYTFGVHTTGGFEVTQPWPVTIDLPRLRAQRAAIRARAQEGGERTS